MDEGGGGRRRLSLFEQMSAVDRTRDLAGLTLEDVIGAKKPPPQPAAAAANPPAAQAPPPPVNRTLLDIIRDEEPNGGSMFGHKDKKSWKAFRDKLRLKRAGAAWTSTVPIPASDVPIQSYNNGNSNNLNSQARSMMTRRSSVRFSAIPTVNAGDSTNGDDSDDQPAFSSSRPQMTRRSSSRFGLSNNAPPDNSSVNATAVGDEPPARSFRPQMSRGTSTRHTGIPAIESEEESIPEGTRQLSVALAEERSLSAREAVAAQQASEAEAAAQAAAEEEHSPEEPSAAAGGAEAEPVRMSLMDLLEETDRQMGVVGSRYTMADVVGCDEEEEEDEGMDGGDGIEHTCCVCMVRHKGAAFIPCGHTFCRLCSRELWVQRGNCPLCNGYILEILDIF